MEDSKPTPEENNSNDSSSEINNQIKEDDDLNASSESLEKESNQDISVKNLSTNNIKEQKIDKSNSLFQRILDKGFDGISTNPNHKMLALLIIILLNLSAFFVIGNIGKAYLRNAGIM